MIPSARERPSAFSARMSEEEPILIIHVHSDSTISLDDADTFTAFSVTAPGRDQAAIVAAFGADAKAGEEGHVWIQIQRLHALGREFGGAKWRDGCDSMIEFARSKGWVDELCGLLRAHIEP